MPDRGAGATSPLARDPDTARGLVLHFGRKGAAATVDARHARLAALHVARGTPPTPFLDPGPFRAVWRGRIHIEFRDRYAFHFEGRGAIELRIDGQALQLDHPKRLKKGHREIEILYRSPDDGDAVARVLWSSSDFAPEPIPPMLLSHDPADAALREGALRRRARVLVAEARCTRCHHPNEPLVLDAGCMPELAADGPTLVDIGARVRRPWLDHWVLEPRKLRADASMPHMLHGDGAADEARDIGAFLASLGAPAPEPAAVAPAPDAVKAGGVLFAQLGCVGCHTRPGAAQDDPERVSLRWVGAKWRAPALVEFLRKPDRHYAWIAMPDFGFELGEASALAAFLRQKSTATLPELAGTREPDAQRGRELVRTRGCLKCHFLDDLGRFPAPRWADLVFEERGCLAVDASARGRAPDLGLDAPDKKALRIVGTDLAPLQRCVPAEFAARQVEALRCNGCHGRDGAADRWSGMVTSVEDLLDGIEEPHLAQTRPELTWAGDKLRPDWTTRLLRREVDPRMRPWLTSRMPAFRAPAALLAKGLAHQHGRGPAPAIPPADPAMAAHGKKLIGPVGGFACVLCHGLGDAKPTGVFEVQGINFAYSAERLRKPYYMRWMRDSLRIDPGSRMPKYSTPEGKTAFTEILGGDAGKQFDAMWHYLSAGRGIK